MGSCSSSPSDVIAEGTQVSNSSNGAEEAALIFSGNMVVSSKVCVCSLLWFKMLAII